MKLHHRLLSYDLLEPLRAGNGAAPLKQTALVRERYRAQLLSAPETARPR